MRASTLLSLVALAACDAGSPSPPPIASFETAGLLSEETYRESTRENRENGGPRIRGALDTRGVFEVRLTDAQDETVRVLFADGTGAFELWPAPGEYAISARLADGRETERVVVRADSGRTTEAPLRVR